MNILDYLNLNSDDKKISSEDSERIISPEITAQLAKKRLDSINCKYEIKQYNIDNIFHSSELFITNPYDLSLKIQPAGNLNGGFSTMGKGTTFDQCRASMYMETIERISLWQHMNSFNPVYHCLNLRTKEINKVAVDTSTSEMVAAGNTYEEAILHGLHEMIEVESIGASSINGSNTGITANLKPYNIIDFKGMFDWPEWIYSSFTVIQIPTVIDKFYTFIALRYPIEDRYSNDYKYEKQEDNVWSKKNIQYTKWRGSKLAYAFTASGINPKKAISRSIQENFQGPDRYKYEGSKKEIPSWLNIINWETLINYEQDTIKKDIDFIIDNIPEQFNVWAVDLSSPELGVPVIKIITDYHMPSNVGAKAVSDLFYD